MITLIAKHKHGEDVFIVKDDDEFYEKALELMRERLEQGYWYDDWDDGVAQHQWRTRAREIADQNNGRAAWHFLESRRDFEYEWVEEGVAR